MNRSEVIRVAVAKFIGHAYTRQRSTRVSKYATPEQAAAAVIANNKRRQECADLTKLRSDLIGTLAAEDTDTLTSFIAATADWYKRLDTLTQDERTNARNNMVHLAQQHSVKVLERKTRAPRKQRNVTVKYMIPDGNGGTKEATAEEAAAFFSANANKPIVGDGLDISNASPSQVHHVSNLFNALSDDKPTA
jgi:hypothetical protein